jgi:CheY-like chemotaxis protein
MGRTPESPTLSRGERPATRRRATSICVLIVDDDAEACEVLEGILADHGYSAIAVSDGREALDILRFIRPRLILLDIHMPIMGGMEFREVQRRDRELLTIPTIVMTASDDEMQLDLAVSETVRKPVRKRDLLELVTQYCGASSLLARGSQTNMRRF